MITYEKYAILRSEKNMKDTDVAREAHIQQSVLSDWKNGKSVPKMDKMIKIADALGMDYFDFVGPVGKFSSLNPNRPQPKPTEREIFNDRLIQLYHNATPDAQKSVMTLLENSQKEVTSKSSKVV